MNACQAHTRAPRQGHPWTAPHGAPQTKETEHDTRAGNLHHHNRRLIVVNLRATGSGEVTELHGFPMAEADRQNALATCPGRYWIVADTP